MGADAALSVPDWGFAGPARTPPTTPLSTACPCGVARTPAMVSIRVTRPHPAQAGALTRGGGWITIVRGAGADAHALRIRQDNKAKGPSRPRFSIAGRFMALRYPRRGE